MLFKKPFDTATFYKKSKNKAVWLSILAVTSAIVVVGAVAWFNGELYQVVAMTSISSTFSDSWKKYTLSVVSGLIGLAAGVWAFRKQRLSRLIRRSIRAFQSDYTDPVSDFVKEQLLYRHLAKNNSFWLGSFGLVILFLTFFYCTCIGLAGLAGAKTQSLFSCFGDGLSNLFAGSVSSLKPADWVWISALGGFWLLYAFLFVIQMRSKSKIDEIWRVCGLGHPEMVYWNDAVVMPRLLRNNKRNKLFIYITFCVLGFPIYFFLKRALGTIFRSNMNNKYS